MKQFTILGERCSGTNFLEKAISANFNLEITWKFGWKHFFGNCDYKDSDDVLFIGIVRDPIQWLCSIYKNPHHLNNSMRQNWDKFLTEECYSYIDDTKSAEYGEEIMDDRHIQTGKRYKNILELRKVKGLFLLNEMPSIVKNYILIRYEDLVDDYVNTLQLIQDRFNLKRKDKDFVRINKRYVAGAISGNFVSPTIRSVPEKYMKLYDNNIDKDVEKELGYNR
jgi:hypothetical protein